MHLGGLHLVGTPDLPHVLLDGPKYPPEQIDPDHHFFVGVLGHQARRVNKLLDLSNVVELVSALGDVALAIVV